MNIEELNIFLTNEQLFYACVKLESAISLMPNGKEKECVKLAYIQLQDIYNMLITKGQVDED